MSFCWVPRQEFHVYMFVVSCFNSRVSCFLIIFGSCLLRQTMKAVNRDQQQLQRLPALWLWWGVSKHTTAFIFFSVTQKERPLCVMSVMPPGPTGKELVCLQKGCERGKLSTNITILILHPPARKALSIHPVWTSNMLYPPVFAVLILYPQRGRCSSNPNVLLPSGHAWHNCRYNGHASDADDFRQLSACDEIWLMDQFDWSSGLL